MKNFYYIIKVNIINLTFKKIFNLLKFKFKSYYIYKIIKLLKLIKSYFIIKFYIINYNLFLNYNVFIYIYIL